MLPALMIVFMQRLIRDAGRKVFLVLDNLGVHKAKAVREWVDAHRDQIALFYLPPYSPELDPNEYLNGDLKRAVHSDVPPKDAAHLKRQVRRHLRTIQRSKARVRAYFKHPRIRYAGDRKFRCKQAGLIIRANKR